jgi:enoyl-[acyl-carrier protein] reductase I
VSDLSSPSLAYELGPAQIRVNAISAGPVRTLAAKGIPGFDQMESVIEERSPLKKNIAAADVGRTVIEIGRRKSSLNARNTPVS